MARYEYQIDGNKVTCTSHYAAKPYTGIAKCDSRDEFDEEVGKILAKFRCDLKIEDKRLKSKREELTNLNKEIDELLKRKEKCTRECYESQNDYCDILYNYSDYLKKINCVITEPVVFTIDNITSEIRDVCAYSLDSIKEISREEKILPVLFENDIYENHESYIIDKIIGHAKCKYLPDTDTLEVHISFINTTIRNSFIYHKLAIDPFGVRNIGPGSDRKCRIIAFSASI